MTTRKVHCTRCSDINGKETSCQCVDIYLPVGKLPEGKTFRELAKAKQLKAKGIKVRKAKRIVHSDGVNEIITLSALDN